MRNINLVLCGWMTLLSAHGNAITIEEMSIKNNQIIELDQDIAIAEKHKKLTQLKNEVMQPETILLQPPVLAQRETSLVVLSVHGTPTNPVVDVQYGDMLLQKRRGEFLPDGWKITSIDGNSVTLSKKVAKRPDLNRTLVIGQADTSFVEGIPAPAAPIPTPSHSNAIK